MDCINEPPGVIYSVFIVLGTKNKTIMQFSNYAIMQSWLSNSLRNDTDIFDKPYLYTAFQEQHFDMTSIINKA